MSTPVFLRLQFLFLLALPIVLWLLPAHFFDDGPTMCFSRLWWGIECLGCGLTRGVMHLIHGQIAAAWEFNPLSFVALPVMGLLWAVWVRRLYFQLFSTPKS